MEINSVLGKISTDMLGCTLMHEHVICCDWSMRQAFGDKWFCREKVVEIAVAQLKRGKELFGISTMVDGTAINLGRDIELIKEIALKADVNIIASTGMYFNEEPYLMRKPIHQLIDLMIGECKSGIKDSGILPGIIKSATDTYGITPLNKQLIYMASEVHKETDLPIFAHSSSMNKTGPMQLDEFERNGVDPNRIIIGHSGDSNDIQYLEELMKRGATIGMDRFGDNEKNTLENRTDTIVKLCEQGFISQMVISHDYSAYIDWGSNSFHNTATRDYMNLEVDYTYVHRKAIPMLLSKGLSKKDIRVLMEENPRRFFERKAVK